LLLFFKSYKGVQMKKTVLLMALSISLTLAQSAKVVEIISENTLKVEENGAEKKLHLSGIELFSKANNTKENNITVNPNEREALKKEALSYIEKMLPKGSTLQYITVSKDKFGIQYVWIDNHELNYKIIRDGFALTNPEDPSLPSGFRNRMLIAQNYAKEKGIGLWGKHKEMSALENQNVVACGCGFTRKRDVASDTLKRLQESLPN